MDYLRYIVNDIHTVVAATTDDNGLPVTCAIDIMDCDEKGLYFLTAKGKGFYNRLSKEKYIALTGIKGSNTMSSVAISVRGTVKEIGTERLSDLFEKNPYMEQIYPTEESRKALTVFCIYEGNGEWFDLSKKPIERDTFQIGNGKKMKDGYSITDKCNACGKCIPLCPQGCISKGTPFVIQQEHCLHCGNCLTICPVNAIEKRK
ncbi:MAG: 4Fe-4S binding protein [Ruminococcus sp.]